MSHKTEEEEKKKEKKRARGGLTSLAMPLGLKCYLWLFGYQFRIQFPIQFQFPIHLAHWTLDLLYFAHTLTWDLGPFVSVDASSSSSSSTPRASR